MESETEQETVEFRASDRQCKAKRRTNETEQETVELVLRASPLHVYSLAFNSCPVGMQSVMQRLDYVCVTMR